MLALAIDLGGSHACGALMNEDGLIAEQTLAVTAASFSNLLPGLEEMAASLFHRSGVARTSCAGMVFGFPGAVDIYTSQVLATNAKYDDTRGFDFQEWSRRQFGCGMVLENDVRLALVGEQHSGAAQNMQDVVMIALGTGIGTAVLLDGKPLRGHTNQAGALGGHLPVRLEGRRCTCGGIGCAEAEASTWALPQICQSWPGYVDSVLAQSNSIDFRELFNAMDGGDAIAKEILEHCMDIWTALAVALTHAYSPQMIVLGGGVMARADDIIPALTARLHKEAWSPGGRAVVRNSMLGSSPALYGALPVLREMRFQ